jgi:thiol-disulfide isomerase/thioredoxin
LNRIILTDTDSGGTNRRVCRLIPFQSLLQCQMMDLDEPRVRAPEFPDSMWLNIYSDVSLHSLQPNVVLLDFWEYTCINCLRTLPYLRAWHERYADLGLTIVGVHTPEFRFGRRPEFVKAAIGRLGIGWPVVLDNDQHIWTSYANCCRPTIHLIDGQGYVRFSRAGDHGYTQIESVIQALLREKDPDVQLPPLPKAEHAPSAVCVPTSQEIHVDALGCPLPQDDKAVEYSLPAHLAEGHFYLAGSWRLKNDGLTISGESGTITLPYHAADVYAVLSPSPHSGGYTRSEHSPLKIEILQDGRPLPVDNYGQDVFKDKDRSMLRIDIPRSYHVAHNSTVRRAELQMRIMETGLTLFAFSFGSCLITDPAEESRGA